MKTSSHSNNMKSRLLMCLIMLKSRQLMRPLTLKKSGKYVHFYNIYYSK